MMEVEKETLKEKLTEAQREGHIPCAVALSTALRCGAAPGMAGEMLDEMGLRIVTCQLGLFGYGAGKQKRIQVPDVIPAEVAAWIAACAEARGHVTCAEIFAFSQEKGRSRALLAGACEKTGVKIRACQLGAFS